MVERHRVDASAALPDGHPVDGAEELSDYLLERQGPTFARALASKMLAYALGRSLVHGDQDKVDGIASRFERAGFRLRDLCAIIVTSDSFRRR